MGSEMHLHRKKRANIAETQFVKSTVGLCRRYVDNSKQKHFVCNLSKHMKILQFSKQHQCPLFRSLSQRGTNIGGGAGGITWPLNETFGRLGPHVSIPKISLAQHTASICGIDNFRAHIFCPMKTNNLPQKHHELRSSTQLSPPTLSLLLVERSLFVQTNNAKDILENTSRGRRFA